jgi:N-acetylmuramate 1-kinase
LEHIDSAQAIDIIIEDSFKNKKANLTKLAGDASTRQYYRVAYPEGTSIIMLQEIFDESKNPFHLCNYAFEKLGIKVPRIIKSYPKIGGIVLEDLGDKHLQHLENYSSDFVKYLMNAVDIIVDFQIAALNCKEQLYPLSYAFTDDKFMNELNMTTNYYLKGLKRRELSNAEENELLDFYRSLIGSMMKQTFWLQHRDYHSRNLIVHNEDLYVIDFQDARLGPYPYDIASFIIDPYSNLDTQMTNRLNIHYYNRISSRLKVSYEEYSLDYSYNLLQRAVKILGTYAYQHMKRHNDVYLQYIPITIEKIREVIHFFPQWEGALEGIILR